MKQRLKTKTDTRDRYVIIMAGGKGERFWPVSREKTPKQLITLLGKTSFLQQAVERVAPLVPLKNIFIITNAIQAPEVRRQLPKLPKQNIIAEPCGRDTCAAVTLGAAVVGARSTTAVMAVLPADHVIPDAKKFQQVLADGFDLAARGRAIVTIGIKPPNPPPVTATSTSARPCRLPRASNPTKPPSSAPNASWRSRTLTAPWNT
jgi:mannose-1-phosphate guanylyltransferase